MKVGKVHDNGDGQAPPPVTPQTEFTKDIVALFEANLRNSDECLELYLEHATKTWRMSVKWAGDRILEREGDSSFDKGERERRIFELAKEIFVKLMPSFPQVESRTWRDMENWNIGNTTMPPAEESQFILGPFHGRGEMKEADHG
jgi:hypothetical protein